MHVTDTSESGTSAPQSAATVPDGSETWTLAQLQAHLQAAVDLEFWTIPFYMSAMYSIKDPGHPAYQAILSVVNQEMLHVQLAANLANAYGLSPGFATPLYYGTHIPHLDFNLDTPDPRAKFSPYSAEIGPLDQARLNTLCLIEYPMWLGTEVPRPGPDYLSYGSIGEFYTAVSVGAEQLKAHIRPHRQVNHFGRFYANFTDMTVTKEGAEGFPQVANIVTGICDQGEGRSGQDTPWSAHIVPAQYRNTADDTDPSWSHFQKFMTLWTADHFPETYTAVTHPEHGSPGHQAQVILEENFTGFLNGLDALFSGGHPASFMTEMFALGGNILNCWKNGAVPRFGRPIALTEDIDGSAPAGARRVFPPLARVRRTVERAKAPVTA